MTYCNALKIFSSAPRVGSESAEHVRLLLSCLGNPERKLRILPVTGDKGKSSVVRMLTGMMAASGIAVSAVIYPCLTPPRENIFLGDKTLSNEEFIFHTARLSAALRCAKKKIEALPDGASASACFSKDELLFCLAVSTAAEVGVKWLILEIPDTPFSPLSTVRFSSAVTVITSCGERVRPGITAMIHPGLNETVSARLPYASAYTAISSACAKAGCRLTVPVFSAVSILESSLGRTVFTYRGKTYTIPLYGDFALTNALCALEAASALRRLGCPITEMGIVKGLACATLPARAETLSVSPTVLTDAACDPFSMWALCSLLRQKGTAIGNSIILCVEPNTEDAFLSDTLSFLSDIGFHIENIVRVSPGTENRTASLLLKTASAENLILTIGTLPFAYAMRNEFSKVLKSM